MVESHNKGVDIQVSTPTFDLEPFYLFKWLFMT